MQLESDTSYCPTRDLKLNDVIVGCNLFTLGAIYFKHPLTVTYKGMLELALTAEDGDGGCLSYEAGMSWLIQDRVNG